MSAVQVGNRHFLSTSKQDERAHNGMPSGTCTHFRDPKLEKVSNLLKLEKSLLSLLLLRNLVQLAPRPLHGVQAPVEPLPYLVDTTEVAMADLLHRSTWNLLSIETHRTRWRKFLISTVSTCPASFGLPSLQGTSDQGRNTPLMK